MMASLQSYGLHKLSIALPVKGTSHHCIGRHLDECKARIVETQLRPMIGQLAAQNFPATHPALRS